MNEETFEYSVAFQNFFSDKVNDIIETETPIDVTIDLSIAYRDDSIIYFGQVKGLTYEVVEEILSYAIDFDCYGNLQNGVQFEARFPIEMIDEYKEVEDETVEEKPIYMKEGRKQMITEMEIDGKVLKSLEKKAEENFEKFGVTYKKLLSVLKKVFKRGVGASRTNPQSVRPHIKAIGGLGTDIAWAHARVNAFLKKGKTYKTADSDLADELKK